MLTATGHLYQLDLEMDLKTLVPEPMAPKWNFNNRRQGPKSPDEFVALAMPKCNLIYSFRIEKNEMILEEVRGNNMPQKKNFLAPSFPDE
jgi:hypothetical protein